MQQPACLNRPDQSWCSCVTPACFMHKWNGCPVAAMMSQHPYPPPRARAGAPGACH